MEQLESVLREVAEELATWRARALKAEGDGKRSGGSGGGGAARSDDGDRQLRGRLEAARSRVRAMVERLAFLEEQAREATGTNDARGGSAAR